MGATRLAVLVALVAAACGAGGEDGGGNAGSGTSPPASSLAPQSTVGETTAPPGSNPSTEPSVVRPPTDVDLSLSSVPLGDVYFDTFDGGSVRLSDSTPALRARLLDAIPPIDGPVYESAESADSWLGADDLVLGYVGGGRAHAFPFRILNFHEIVNDVIGDVPVLVSYCPLCRSAIVYERVVGERELSFGNTSALYESDLVMVDRETFSYWWQVAGEAIVGELTRTRLEPLPSTVATWAQWKQSHPGTIVLSRDTGFERPYDRDPFLGYEEIIDEGRFAFPVGDAARDPRLAASALVVAVEVGSVVRSYPVERVAGPVNDTVDGVPVVVLPVTGGAAVFFPVVGGDVLEFVESGGVWSDTSTGSTWDGTGAAVAGPLAGSRLEPAPSRTSFWFAIVGAFPDTEVWAG